MRRDALVMLFDPELVLRLAPTVGRVYLFRFPYRQITSLLPLQGMELSPRQIYGEPPCNSMVDGEGEVNRNCIGGAGDAFIATTTYSY